MPREEALQTVCVNGVRLHYASAGDGPPILLVHGNGEDHRLFDGLVPRLTGAGLRVYAPDSRGHGANGPLAEYHYADMAEDVYQLIRALGLNRPAYYGHSDGGIIGLMLEIMHPGTLGALAAGGANLTPEGIDAGFLKECAARNREAPNPLETMMLTEPHIPPEALGKIACPALIVAGENDLIRREETLRIAAGLPLAHLVIVDGADHGSYIQDTMGALLPAFLAEPPCKAVTVAAETKYIETVAAFIGGELEKRGFSRRQQTELRAVIGELISRAARQAGAPGAGEITVRFEYAEESRTAALTFIGRGVPREPGLLPAEWPADGRTYRFAEGCGILRMTKKTG